MRHLLFAVFILSLVACHPSEKAPAKVFVITKTQETSQLAEDFVNKKQWKKSEPQKATRVVIVIRTAEQNPLADTFKTMGELEKAADSKSDKTSNSFIIYSFVQDDKHQLTLDEKVVVGDPLLNH